MNETGNLLSGIRVIDCGTFIAAPAAAVVLGDFGADVIKIERPPHGDPYRYLSLNPAMPVCDDLYCWTLTGRNKKSVALNLEHPEARQILLKLVATADVFITNFQASLLDKFHLNYDELSAVNERLVYAHLTGYGETGQDATRPGYDVTAYYARSGLMHTLHEDGAEPVQSPAGVGDHPTAMSVFAGVMLALYRREITGRGMKVMTSLMANGAWANACNLQAALLGAEFRPRWHRRSVPNPLVNHYLAADGKRFLICCLEHKDWFNLCAAIGQPGLVDHARFCTPELRRTNAPELVEIFDQAMAAHTMNEWVGIFARHSVVWGPVPSTTEVAQDAQMIENGVFPENTTGVRTVANPITALGTEKRQPGPAPRVGEHTAEILRELGYDGASIDALAQRGAAMQATAAKQPVP